MPLGIRSIHNMPLIPIKNEKFHKLISTWYRLYLEKKKNNKILRVLEIEVYSIVVIKNEIMTQSSGSPCCVTGSNY